MKVHGDIEGYILAGGASTRMGVDKASLRLGGETLLQRSIKTMLWLTDKITVVGRRDAQLADESKDVRFVNDLELPNAAAKRAPIIGLYTALNAAESEWIAVLAVDLPFVTSELLIRLHSFCDVETDAVIPIQPDERLQPLCAFYRKDVCQPIAKQIIESEDLRLHKMIAAVRTRLILFAEIRDLHNSGKFFLNVNTPADYTRAMTSSSDDQRSFGPNMSEEIAD